MLLVILGSLIISLALSYAWWTRVRVVNLRQDIFDIRDELLDEAADCSGLQDAAYKQARAWLNGMAAGAHVIASGPVLVYIHTLQRRTESASKRPKSDIAKLNKAIDSAVSKCGLRIARYILRETLPGIVFSCLAVFTPSRRLLIAEAERFAGEVVHSTDPTLLPVL